MRACGYRCGFAHVASRRESSRFAWPCDPGATRYGSGVKDARADQAAWSPAVRGERVYVQGLELGEGSPLVIIPVEE
jgi:hypothetical protein